MARPIPRELPVTNALRPSSGNPDTRTSPRPRIHSVATRRVFLESVELAVQVRELHAQFMRRLVSIEANGTLEIERQPFLRAAQAFALGEVHEQDQIEQQRGRQNAVTAEEVDLELHRIAEPAEKVDRVPALLVVTTRRVVCDLNLV